MSSWSHSTPPSPPYLRPLHGWRAHWWVCSTAERSATHSVHTKQSAAAARTWLGLRAARARRGLVLGRLEVYVGMGSGLCLDSGSGSSCDCETRGLGWRRISRVLVHKVEPHLILMPQWTPRLKLRARLRHEQHHRAHSCRSGHLDVTAAEPEERLGERASVRDLRRRPAGGSSGHTGCLAGKSRLC